MPVGAQLAAEVEAVDARQQHVEDDEVVVVDARPARARRRRRARRPPRRRAPAAPSRAPRRPRVRPRRRGSSSVLLSGRCAGQPGEGAGHLLAPALRPSGTPSVAAERDAFALRLAERRPRPRDRPRAIGRTAGLPSDRRSATRRCEARPTARPADIAPSVTRRARPAASTSRGPPTRSSRIVRARIAARTGIGRSHRARLALRDDVQAAVWRDQQRLGIVGAVWVRRVKHPIDLRGSSSPSAGSGTR